MPDETTTTDDASQTDDASTTDTSTDDDTVVAQAENPDAVKKAIRRHQEAARAEKKKAEAAEAKVREYEDRDKSAQEKAEQKAAEAERKAQAAEAKLLRLTIAGEKKLPPELASRLQGETEDELKADADNLLKLVKAENSTGFDGGARTPAPTSDMDSMIRDAANR